MRVTGRQILIFSVLASIFLWTLDAFIGSFLFDGGPFLGLLLLDLTPHELYFRLIFTSSFIAFGLIIASLINKRNRAGERLGAALKRAEDEKAKSEAILAAIGDGISIQGRDFTVLYQNEAHVEHIGSHVGERCYEAFLHRFSVCKGCPVKTCFEDGKVHRAEFYNERVDTYVEITASPLRDHTGEIIGGIEVVRDVTSRKKAEEKLKVFSRAVEEAPDGVQIVDLNGIIRYSNKAVEEMYGFSREELLGMHVTYLNVNPEIAYGIILPSIKENGSWIGDLTVKSKNGSEFPIWLNTSLVKDERGEPIAMVGVIRNMQDRKEAEKERENLIADLEKALHEIRALRGLIPTCAWCKKVRNDAGAHFTHGICEDCLRQAFSHKKKPE